MNATRLVVVAALAVVAVALAPVGSRTWVNAAGVVVCVIALLAYVADRKDDDQ